MVKKIWKTLGLIIACAVLLCAPTATLISTGVQAGLRAFDSANNTFHHDAPNQTENAFDYRTTRYPLTESNWSRNSNDNVIIQDATVENNDKYHGNTDYTAYTLTKEQLKNHDNAVMLLRKKNGIEANGSLTGPTITLEANSYYEVAVKYFMKAETSEQSKFYMGDYSIELHAQGDWSTSIMYIKTDSIVSTKLTPKLYLGDDKQKVNGAIYYDDFTVTALSQTKFEIATEAISAKIDCQIFDLSNIKDVVDVDTSNPKDWFANTNFVKDPAMGTVPATTIIDNEVSYQDVPSMLKFAKRDYFHTQNGKGNVMLLACENNNARLIMETEQLNMKMHEVYMFQFYSLMPANNEHFYFIINDSYEEILAYDCQNHNGWQLNTIFYVCGRQPKAKTTLGFTLAENKNTVSTWVALDQLKVYRVSGAFAENNQTATGVHVLDDINKAESKPDISNAYFDLGIASDVLLPNGTPNNNYPYPLKASGDWTMQNGDNNCIVNTSYWIYDDVVNPGAIGEDDENNHILMLRNLDDADNQNNVVTSPVLTTTAGKSTYISFDACAYNNAPVTAKIIAEVTDNDQTVNIEIARLMVQANQWKHYEFEIKENELTQTRNYRLTFTMDNKGCAFLDNIRSTTDGAFEFSSAEKTITTTADLTKTVAYSAMWQDTANADNLVVNVDGNGYGVTLRNAQKVTTTAKNLFAYSLTVETYYKVTVKAYGENAYLKLDGFDGYLTVTNDEDDTLQEYTFYFKATDTTTTVNFLVVLGIEPKADNDDAENCDANIYLSEINIVSVNEQDYNWAEKSTDARVKALTASVINEEEETVTDDEPESANDFWAQNWWYLVPSLITALAVILALIAFFLRKIKFDKHITNKTTSYARDVKIKSNKKKIVAEKSAKVDNVTDATPNN